MKRAKEFHDKHQYSGPGVSRKRSRAAITAFYGPLVTTRAQAWDQKPPNINTETEPEKVPDQTTEGQKDPPERCSNIVEIRAIDAVHTDKNVTPNCSSESKPAEPVQLKTYKAVHRSKKVPLPLSTQQKSKPPPATDIHWPIPDPNVEKHQLVIETEPPKNNMETLDGYRVVDIKHVLNWAFKLQADHARECTCSLVQFRKEHRDGLSSTLTFQCTTCMKYFHHDTDPSDKLNKSFVWGTLTSASHYSQASQILSSMDIPHMPVERFRKTEDLLGKVWEDHLLLEMAAAGEEEKAAAIAKGHVCADGIPYITVCVDGGWCKRSYGHNFNASSGIACIIGAETKKCLFLGVRNKYCAMCAFNTKNRTEKPHVCFRNYEGSSTGMEANILVEGFSKSIEMHGLRYTSFIGDGDSSVFARLKEKVSYGNLIKKKECKNHVIKNFTSSLYKISADTKLKLASRKIVKAKLTRLTTVARLNIKQENAEKIRKDLKNGMLHVFGDHQNCEAYYCRWQQALDKNMEPLQADENVVPILKNDILVWAALETAIENICRKADRLTSDQTNNIAENFMSLMAKYTCGKRIHLSRKGSYHRRAQIAGLCQISGQKWQIPAMKKALGKSPGLYFKRSIQKKVKSAVVRSKLIRRRLFKKKEKSCPADKEYGPSADDVSPEISTHDLEVQCQTKLRELQISSLEEIAVIQAKTIGQHGNLLYDEMRKDRLTASQFGMICKRRSGTPCDNHVKAVLYKSNFSNVDTAYGQNCEKVALRMFEVVTEKTVIPSGLFIDSELGFLGASPDGIVAGESSIVEVKTFPSLARTGQSLIEAAKAKKNFCLKLDSDGHVELRKNHNYYYQIQGQIHVAKKEKCYLVLFVKSEEPISILSIKKDGPFIAAMLKKLERFYWCCILPEIVLRRIPNKQKCRELATSSGEGSNSK